MDTLLVDKQANLQYYMSNYTQFYKKFRSPASSVEKTWNTSPGKR